MSILPLRGFRQRSIGTLLSPIATPRNPAPRFGIRPYEAVTPKVAPVVVIDGSSAFKASGLSFLENASTETKAAPSTFDDLLYASATCDEFGGDTTLASAAEVYVTPSARSPHGSSSVAASTGVSTIDPKSPVRVQVPTLKRKRLDDGTKNICNSPVILDANNRNCSGKHFPSLAVHLQKATKGESQESSLDSEPATHCRCKRSRCLKKYCACYHVDALCNEACVCTNCGNNEL